MPPERSGWDWRLLGAAAGAGAAAGWLLARAAARPRVWGRGPRPGWRPGDPQAPPWGPGGGRAVELDPRELGPRRCYPLLISSVVPRPIALVSSVSAAGVRNLAPFSYFSAFHDPPSVVVTVCRAAYRPGDRKKDTLANIEATKEFVVNVVSEWYVEGANHTCGNFDAEEDEIALAGLATTPSSVVAPERVASAAVAMECRLTHNLEMVGQAGEPSANVLIGEIVRWHVQEGCLGQTPSGSPYVVLDKLKPIGRMGGNTYARPLECFDYPRPAQKAKRDV